MARATAICTCRKCGAKFEKATTMRNRRDANIWESWAEDHFDLCPDCDRQARWEREKANGLIVKFCLDYDAAINGKFACVAVVTNCGYDYKEQLKDLGYIWVNNRPGHNPGDLGNVLYDGQRCWAKRVARDGITAACNEIVAIGGTCVVPPDDEKQLYAELLADGKKKAEIRRERYAAALEQLGPKPEYPQDVADIFSGGHWNGTFYGGPGNWSVYINGEKRALTDEQKRAKKKIGKARAEWNARAAEIKQNGGNRS